MPQSSSFFKDQPMQVQSHLLSSSHVSFIPLGYIFNISLPFGTAVQVCYLNTEGTENGPWKRFRSLYVESVL